MRVLIINCFETYEHRVELIREYFLENGYEVKVITSDWLHMSKTIRRDCPEGYDMLHVQPYTKNLSPQRLTSHIGFSKAAQKKIGEYKPDLIWALIPPNSLTKAVATYKIKHPAVKLVMDLIDMWPETMPISHFKNAFPFTSWRKLRNNYLQYADSVVTECDLYRTVLGGICATNKIHTLYLGRKSAGVIPKPNPPTDRTVLCYLGSINNIIDIPCIENVIRCIEGDVELHIIGDGEKRQELIERASEAKAKVIYHGKIYDPEEKQRIMDQCHFGLNIMKDSVFVGLTMKSMDYFESGLPIINTIKGDTWRIVEENGIGINYSGDMSFEKNMILPTLADKQRVKLVFEHNFSIEAFQKRLDEILSPLI